MRPREESVLGPMLNLACTRGHRWFSPEPEAFADGIHGCGYPVSQAPGHAPKMCQEKLELLPRPEGGDDG